MDDSKMGDFMKLVEQSITNQSTQSAMNTTAVLPDLVLLRRSWPAIRIKSGNLKDKTKCSVATLLATRRYVSFNSIAIKT
jgi:hypothetical protein